MDKKRTTIILTTLFVYIISAGISYALFSNVPGGKSPISSPLPAVKQGANGSVAFDDALPKTESCPLNGTLYSKQQRQWWEKHRPLGVMIENHKNARPQSGLSFADIIYEAVAEGGITRFLAIYYCQDGAQIGPIRSARTYFLDFISEYGDSPLYAHVGGANTSGPADALGQITDYGWTGYNDLNQFSIGFPTFWRDYDRLGHTTETEHTMYSTTSKLWQFADKSRQLTNVDKKGNSWDTKFVSYTFKDDAAIAERPQNQTVRLEFWKGYSEYFIDWTYDKALNVYKRSNSGAHIDKNTDKQLTTKNIVIFSMQESRANDGYEGNLHLLYKTKGSGKAIILQDGKKITATWKKDGRTARTLLFDTNGAPIKFNRGKIWFEILPLDGVADIK